MRFVRSIPCYSMSLALAGLAMISTGCGSKATSTPTANIEGDGASAATSGGTSGTPNIPSTAGTPVRRAENLHPSVSIKTSLGVIKVKLDAEKAPVTVENFLENYVGRAYYNNTVFHYVSKDMVLGGGYTANLEPKDARAPIRCEAANGLKNVRGTIAMARVAEFPDTASSQFFFNVTDNAKFDHKGEELATYGYCVFGEIVEGLDVLDQIAATQTHDKGDFVSTPVKPIIIESVTRLD